MFGFFRKKSEVASESEGELFDEAFQRKLEPLAIAARRTFAGKMRAERRSKKTGAGIEFADHRDYTPGDDFRTLDWNVYKRSGKLLVRLFEEEEDLSIYLLVDASRSMGMGKSSKLRYAKQLAAALAYVGLAKLDRVSILAISGDKLERMPPTRSKRRIFSVFDFLRPVTASGDTSLEKAMRKFASQHKRRGIAVLLSDLYDPAGFERAVDELRFAQFETYVLHIVDEKEAQPEFQGDVRLVDVETGLTEEVTVTPALLEKFAAAHRELRERAATYCGEKHVTYFEVSTTVPFDETVMSVLRHGGMLR